MATRIIAVVCLAGVFCGTLGGNIPPITPQYDTIIVGLGPAGCTAASTLAQAGKSVLALEAQNRIGGRVMTVPFSDGIVEVGAEWIHGTKSSRVYELAIRNNLTIIPQDDVTEMYRSDGSKADRNLVNELVDHSLKVVDQPPKDPEPLGQYITKKLNQYIAEKHPELLQDKDFIEEFLHFMDLVINSYESSNSWNDVTTHTKYEELEGSQVMSWHRQGYSTLFEILLNTYKNGPGYPNLEIKLNTEVTQIAWPQEPSQNVVVTCKDGATYTAKNVIVTVSVGVLKERHRTLFTPQLPQSKITSIEKIAFGVVGKIILSFDEVWWPENVVFFGFIWKGDERNNVPKEDSWITGTNGAVRTMGSNYTLCFWTNGDNTKLVETLPDELVKTKIMQVLRRFMGANTTIPEPTGMVRSFWHSNPFTRGSYSYDNIETPLYPNARADLAQPLTDEAGRPRVLFAGEATDRTHFSTVHGAIDTGYREAMRIINVTP